MFFLIISFVALCVLENPIPHLYPISQMAKMTTDTTKRLMPSPKCKSVEVINNPARPGSNHREINYINYR
jgi:hypothetical protein